MARRRRGQTSDDAPDSGVVVAPEPEAKAAPEIGPAETLSEPDAPEPEPAAAKPVAASPRPVKVAPGKCIYFGRVIRNAGDLVEPGLATPDVIADLLRKGFLFQ